MVIMNYLKKSLLIHGEVKPNGMLELSFVKKYKIYPGVNRAQEMDKGIANIR